MTSILQRSLPENFIVRFNSSFINREVKSIYDVFKKYENVDQNEEIIINEVRKLLDSLGHVNYHWVVVVGERFYVEDTDPERHRNVGLLADFYPSARHALPLKLVLVKAPLINRPEPMPGANGGSIRYLTHQAASWFCHVVHSILASSTRRGGASDCLARALGKYLMQQLPNYNTLVIVGDSIFCQADSEDDLIFSGTAADMVVIVFRLGRR
ncbi:hypothetical protein BIW11_10373 [Tropilaelaps mercedesae]|uniref:Uncharacterized protein n=1 Tax=Tropilaelaps mercedesae TaxID=418985 RepID=A0A1V9XFZ3_9ACAR|nr:hypothetical protein BIW11_10373 [Tropilaelaps mercedesae]